MGNYNHKYDEFDSQDREFQMPKPTGKKFVSYWVNKVCCLHRWKSLNNKGHRVCLICKATSVIENDKLIEYDATANIL